jgi:hypothetical protein
MCFCDTLEVVGDLTKEEKIQDLFCNWVEEIAAAKLEPESIMLVVL